MLVVVTPVRYSVNKQLKWGFPEPSDMVMGVVAQSEATEVPLAIESK